MDMLSESAENGSGPLELPNVEVPAPDFPTPPNNVYYLPTVFTKLQKDMCEAVVQIFAPALARLIVVKGQRASINSLLESDKPVYNGQVDNYEMDIQELGALMFDQLLRLSRHPSLVVDHFIPKKLLLLEVKERLLHMSGKLEFFDRLVDFVAKKYATVPLGTVLDDYNMLVVAESVKELEWIEGLVIGKKLHYRNLSARKLYDDEGSLKFVKEESVDDDQQNFEFKRRRRHFVARHTRKKVHIPEFTLHLVTSRQLYLSYSSGIAFDMIMSFDGELDVGSASIELLRSNNRVTNMLTRRVEKTPVIVPIPLYSVEHIMLLLPRPTYSNSEKAWKLQITSAFVANRTNLFKQTDTNFYLDMYGRNFLALLDWLFHWEKVGISGLVKPLHHFNDDVMLSYTDEKLAARLSENHLQALGKIFADTTNGWENNSEALFEGPIQVNYEVFKTRLAEFLTSRREQVETLIREGNTNVLPGFRQAEALRQKEIDTHEDLVGEEYRKLRKLTEQANIVDRKFNRAESEYVRASGQESETAEMLKHLSEVVTEKSEEEIGEMLESQNQLVSQLEEEKAKLTEEYSKLVENADLLRTDYQTKSSEAVQAISALNNAKALHDLFEAKLNRPGMTTLPALSRKDEKLMYDEQLRRLRLENKFITQMFLRRLDQLVKERNTILDSTLSGSTSRPSNRISRASTPFT